MRSRWKTIPGQDCVEVRQIRQLNLHFRKIRVEINRIQEHVDATLDWQLRYAVQIREMSKNSAFNASET